jgi:hypothetical protein
VPIRFAVKSDAEVDPGLRRKLQAELPGVLNLALRGLRRLLENGGFTQCDVCDAAKAEHRLECSPVGKFVRDRFTVAKDYAGDRVGVRWVTTSNEILTEVKNHNAKYGDRLAGHVVCREVAKLPGVFSRRPATAGGREAFGTVYVGVCLGDPRKWLPDDVDELAEATHLDLAADLAEIAAGPSGEGTKAPGSGKAAKSKAAKSKTGKATARAPKTNPKTKTKTKTNPKTKTDPKTKKA